MANFPCTQVPRLRRCILPGYKRKSSFVSMRERSRSSYSRTLSTSRRQQAVRINLWSSPRCSSTSMMYSFAQRPNCTVYDEPLYAFYLKKTGEERPYRDEVLKSQDSCAAKVISNIILGNDSAYPGKSSEDQDTTEHVLLIRHPFKVFASFFKTMGTANLHDTCLVDLCRIKDELLKREKKFIVIQNENLVRKPRDVLTTVCHELDIKFLEEMLTWEKGGRPEDGVWAPFWYESTHQNDSFSYNEYSMKAPEDYLQGLPSEVVSAAKESLYYYEQLLEYDVS